MDAFGKGELFHIKVIFTQAINCGVNEVDNI
jgi:hypothetical protein